MVSYSLLIKPSAVKELELLPRQDRLRIIEKIRGHVMKLPAERQAWWSEQVATLGVVLIPKSVEKRLNALKDE